MNKKLAVTSLVLIIFLALGITYYVQSRSSGGGGSGKENGSELVGDAATPNRMVIVGVLIDPPFQPDGSLAPEKQTEQRANIQKSVDEVLKNLNPSSYTGLKRFQFIPFFAIAVNDSAYNYLSKHPLVTNIEEDRLGSVAGTNPPATLDPSTIRPFKP